MTVHTAGGSDVVAVYQGKLGGVTVNVPQPWSAAGIGNGVFTDMPAYVTKVRVTGHYTGYSENFVIYVGGRLLVNELVGSARNAVDYSGTFLTHGASGAIEVKYSSGVQWTLTEVRD